MPFISTRTNQEITKEKEASIAEKFGKAIGFWGKAKAGSCWIFRIIAGCILKETRQAHMPMWRFNCSAKRRMPLMT